VHTALKSNIPVIRIGLQANEGLNTDSILAGCWHPALGDLVYSELFYDLLVQMAGSDHDNAQTIKRIRVGCHPTRVSSVIGHRRTNISRLHGLGIAVERVTPNRALSPFESEISFCDKSAKGSIINNLSALYA